MKLECPCGAKYAFDATPEMLEHPVKFVCPTCGLDSSDFVNELIRQEFAGPTPPPPPAPPAPAPGRLRIAHEAAPVAQPAAAPAASKFCSKHRERATEKCAVCQKPICPKCMAMFGFFCSPLCKGKAEAQNLDVPVYGGRKDVVEALFWRKTGLIIGMAVGAIVLFLGLWTWYAWFGSVPHSYFSVRFADDNRGYFGSAQIASPEQIVFLHGGTLARYDMKTKKPVWSVELVTPEQVANAVKAENDEEERLSEGGGYRNHRSGGDIERSAVQFLQSQLSLHVSGQNVWVDKGETLTHYDWDTGKVLGEVTVPAGDGELVQNGDELDMAGPQSVTQVNLISGETHVETLGTGGSAAVAASGRVGAGGVPGAVADGGGRINPNTIEAQAQHLTLPAQIALPALLSNARHEQDLENALNDNPGHPRPTASNLPPVGAEEFQVVGGASGFAQFSTRLLEAHEVVRSGMKAPPKKSVLDGNLTAGNSGEAVNEIANEMRRNAGGDLVTNNESIYQVTVHLPEAGTADWAGEVVGPPRLFVLKSVNVIAAGQTVIVLDKTNKKLWEASLTYPVASGGGPSSPYGAGPCVEHGDTLYVFDQAVLTAFNLSSGDARWRLPSVGVVGLLFDDAGDVYVNTTTGNPDDIRYSRQIDVNRSTEAVVYKVDPKNGKTLWTVKPGGFISYLSGKYIYVLDSFDPNPDDHDVLSDSLTGLEQPAYLRIARLQPSDGHILWDYRELDRCPVNTVFDQNTIELIFKREVQVLHYLTL